MNKIFISIICILLLTSFVFAQNNIDQVQIQNQEEDNANANLSNSVGLQKRILTQAQIQKIKTIRNQIKAHYADQTECPENCVCSGSTIKCDLENGREMTITAGKSGNKIVQVKGTNMSTNVTLYKFNNTLHGVFRNNETREINFLPDHVQEKIRERIKARLENQTIELDEDGIYRIQGKKKARLFFLFPVRERVRTQIDSETGEVIKVRNPWWGFLAKDIEDEEETEEEEEESNETEE